MHRRQAQTPAQSLQAQTELERLGSVQAVDHHGVADPADHLGLVLHGQARHLGRKRNRDLGGRFIALELRERRVAGDVREEEGVELDFHAGTTLRREGLTRIVRLPYSWGAGRPIFTPQAA
jgi:hypothetical protein